MEMTLLIFMCGLLVFIEIVSQLRGERTIDLLVSGITFFVVTINCCLIVFFPEKQSLLGSISLVILICSYIVIMIRDCRSC